MSKIRLLSIGAGLLLALNIVLLFVLTKNSGQPLIGRRPHDPDRPKKVIIKRLQFDEEQVKKYQVLIDGHRRDVSNLERQIRTTKNKLYLTLTDDSHAGKDSLENHLVMLNKKMEEVHYNHFADIRALCQPQQLQFFKELTQELAFFFAQERKMSPPPKD